MRRFDASGLAFDVDDRGADGPGVVLLHGFPQTRTSWHRLTPVLVRAGYRVLAPDQRGYSPGARPRSRRAYTLDRLADDVLALADAAGLARFHVVGHDWGAAVAWALGATRPDRVAGLTALSTPHGRAMGRSMLTGAQLVRSWYVLAFQLPWLPEVALRAGSGRRLAAALARSGLPPDQVQASMALLRSPAARPTVNWYRALPFTPPAALGPVTVPTLYVHGRDDPFLGRRAADRTGDHVTGPYRYEAWDGVGHWLPEEVDRLAPPLLAHLAAHPA